MGQQCAFANWPGIPIAVRTSSRSFAGDCNPACYTGVRSGGGRAQAGDDAAFVRLALQAVDRLFGSHSRRDKPSDVLEFQDHSLLNARRSSDKSDAPFVEYVRALNVDQPPDLIIAIGAPAANFVQQHRKDLFPATPMLFTAVERRRVVFDKLTEYDTVVASSNDDPVFFENMLRVLPLTKTIAIVVGVLPAETFWREEVRKATALFADRVQFRWYNELSFEDIFKDAAALPPHSAIFWLSMNVDAAGVAHEGSSALLRLSARANAPVFPMITPFSARQPSVAQCSRCGG